MEMSQKIFECYSLRLAMYLIDQGFIVIRLRPDIKKSGKTLANTQRWACKDCGKKFV